ncbi:DUF6941 family protein [Arthrobacter sp. TMN-49]
MGESSSAVNGTILIADFVNVDAAGKVNIIGGGIQFLGFDPASGLTAPFAVYVSVTVNIPSFEDASASVQVLLVDADGQAVAITGPDGTNTMRFSQDVDFRHIDAPQLQEPPMGFPGKSNIVLNFPSGLPLNVKATYEWVVLMDQTPLASTTFFVPGPAEA